MLTFPQPSSKNKPQPPSSTDRGPEEAGIARGGSASCVCKKAQNLSKAMINCLGQLHLKDCIICQQVFLFKIFEGNGLTAFKRCVETELLMQELHGIFERSRLRRRRKDVTWRALAFPATQKDFRLLSKSRCKSRGVSSRAARAGSVGLAGFSADFGVEAGLERPGCCSSKDPQSKTDLLFGISQTLHVCQICLHWGGFGGQCRLYMAYTECLGI